MDTEYSGCAVMRCAKVRCSLYLTQLVGMASARSRQDLCVCVIQLCMQNAYMAMSYEILKLFVVSVVCIWLC